MTTEDFFDEPTPESLAKIDLVATFVPAWLNIIGRSQYRGGLAYMELFAGAGIYRNGTKSTPIRVVEHILSTPYASRFRIVLNEMKPDYADRLEAALDNLPVDRLLQKPILLREEVDSKNAAKFLDYLSDFPAVLFVDPWGYRGIARDLFSRFVSVGWGRDSIFFFNYKRINAALSNPDFAENMEAMFGAARAARLRDELQPLEGQRREEKIHDAMEKSLREVGLRFVQRYDFEKRHDSLFFITQKEKGLDTMKKVMAKRSSKDDHDVPSFSFDREGPSPQTSLFSELVNPLNDLRSDLLARFAGHTLTFDQLYRTHHPGTRFIERNYREVLLRMEAEGTIELSPKNRRKGTLAHHVRVKFPNGR